MTVQLTPPAASPLEVVGAVSSCRSLVFGVRVGSRPDHPVRRGLDGLLRAVGRR